ncbi:MAG TPA: efflux RND transporter periplasmic adaptor subunit [Steroidobacteraceae bacterium]|nr:efflux RND transporter periplasmic adaptor subunit [Steroidobacteraceae bacterium]
MSVRLLPGVALILLLGAVHGCKSGSEESEAKPIATVEVQGATEHPVAHTLTAYGTVEFVPAHTRALTVQVESQVAERFVLPGTVVKQGQPLLRLIPSASSRLDVDKAARDASVAVADAQRVQRLHAQGLATDSELRAARAAADTAVALRDSLVARIGAAQPDDSSANGAAAHRGITLTAPISGVVDSLTAQPGDVMPAGTLLLRVDDPNAIYVRLGVEPDEAALVHAGQAVTLWELFPHAAGHNGNVAEIDARVDQQTRLSMAVVHPDPDSGLIPGSSVRARVILETHSHALTVPRSAVLYANEQPFLYVAVDGKAQRRSISTGIRDGDLIEVTAGLKAGEPVVTGGNYELEDGMAIRAAARQGGGAPTDRRGAPTDRGGAPGKSPTKTRPDAS